MRMILALVASLLAQSALAQTEQEIRIVQSLLASNNFNGIEVTGVEDRATLSAAESLAAYLKPKHKIAKNPVATIRGFLDGLTGPKPGGVGVFQGAYTCSGQQIPVTVTVVGKRFKLERQIIFEFGVKDSTTELWGIFTLRSKERYGRDLDFFPNQWVVQPDGYEMFGLKGGIEGDTLSGTLSAENCGDLIATRVTSSVECRKIMTSFGERCVREPETIARATSYGPVIPGFCTATKGAYGEAKLACDISVAKTTEDTAQLRELTEIPVPIGSDSAKWLETLKSQASFYLGIMYLEGLTVEPDAEIARNLLEQAVATGLKSYRVSTRPNAEKVYGRYVGQSGHHVHVPSLVDDLYLVAFADGTLPEDKVGQSELSKINAAVTLRGRRGQNIGLAAVIERLGNLPIVDEASHRAAYRETLQRLAPGDAQAAWLGHQWLDSRWEDYLVTAARLGHPKAAAIVGKRLSAGDTFELSRAVRIERSERDQMAVDLLQLASRAGINDAHDALATLVARLDAEEAAKLAREQERAEAERLRHQKREAARQAARERQAARKDALRALDIQPIKRADVQRALDLLLYDVIALHSRLHFGKNLAGLSGGRVYFAVVSMKYQIQSFDGCDQVGGLAYCQVKFSTDVKDEMNFGTGGIHGDIAAMMRGIGNTERVDSTLELRFVDGEWEVQMNPRRLLTFR